jgi:peptidyl-Lys metalloendopeptidase
MKHPFVHAVAGSAVLAGAIAAAVAAPQQVASNPLRVAMYAAANGSVEVMVTNTGNKTARVPKWQLPSTMLEARLFSVSLDGHPVAYQGPMIKRGLPGPADFAILRPGQSYRTVVDLAASYDMSKRGQYNVTLASPLQFASLSDGRMLKTSRGLPMVLQSPALRLWNDGTAAKGAAPDRGMQKGKPGSGGTVVNGVTFKGCSTTQISGAGDAVLQARSYSENAKGYLAAGTVGPRYTTWFGAYTSARYGTASQHFVAIDSAMDQSGGQVTINCGCSQNYYAYVYPTRPYEIFVCKAFWSAPLAGTDSKGGTLIHEMSHFNVTAATDDHVYGQAGAKNLAISDPAAALDNADSHEYFAENKPAQN